LGPKPNVVHPDPENMCCCSLKGELYIDTERRELSKQFCM